MYLNITVDTEFHARAVYLTQLTAEGTSPSLQANGAQGEIKNQYFFPGSVTFSLDYLFACEMTTKNKSKAQFCFKTVPYKNTFHKQIESHACPVVTENNSVQKWLRTLTRVFSGTHTSREASNRRRLMQHTQHVKYSEVSLRLLTGKGGFSNNVRDA